MFVVLCYDVGIKRNAKAKRLAGKFLRPVQESVCEGFITDRRLNSLLRQFALLIDPAEDSVVIYKFKSDDSAEKTCIGQAKRNEDFIL